MSFWHRDFGIRWLVFLFCCWSACVQGFLLADMISYRDQQTRPHRFFAAARRRLSIDFGVVSLDGSDPGRPQKVNQDSIFVDMCNNNNIQCFGVLDGHGLHGHVVSSFLSSALVSCIHTEWTTQRSYDEHNDVDEGSAMMKEFEEQLVNLAKFHSYTTGRDLQRGSIECILSRAFVQAHLDAMRDSSTPAGRSGSTCIACVIEENMLHTAYVGDSKAILWTENDDERIITLAEPTTATNQSERERLDQCEGRIDGGGNIFYGPVGISMTRALGDGVMLRAGVVPVPMVRTLELLRLPSEEEYTLVLATDGLWDVMSPEKVRRVVQRKLHAIASLESTAQFLAETARSFWLADLPIESKVDDITCLLVTIKQQQ